MGGESGGTPIRPRALSEASDMAVDMAASSSPGDMTGEVTCRAGNEQSSLLRRHMSVFVVLFGVCVWVCLGLGVRAVLCCLLCSVHVLCFVRRSVPQLSEYGPDEHAG